MNQPEAKHVLVVDDDAAYRRIVARMLVGAGFKVTVAEDFRAAMRVIDGSDPVDLLLTDIGLPLGTPHGLSLGSVARVQHPALKVLFMTGDQDPAKFALFAPESTSVLAKPFDAEALIAAVNSMLA
ncbi:MAG TPA: response regulator [Stellaceae bacterium]|nr:response regulator [Stellaceae bacterium]